MVLRIADRLVTHSFVDTRSFLVYMDSPLIGFSHQGGQIEDYHVQDRTGLVGVMLKLFILVWQDHRARFRPTKLVCFGSKLHFWSWSV